jgi:RNA polymerase sigma factor (TIGR02999 family)
MPPRDISQLLADLRVGDPDALEHLMPVVYAELRKLAAHYLRRERSGHTLQPTALVHEMYVRLAAHVDQHGGAAWENRAHFFGIAARVMRQVLVDYARAGGAAKRAAGRRVTLREWSHVTAGPDIDILALEAALTRLATLDAGQARLVELRFFAGLTLEEAADVLGRSPRTLKRDWRSARAWLQRELSGATPIESPDPPSGVEPPEPQ